MRALSLTFSERSLLHQRLTATMASCCIGWCQSAGQHKPPCLGLHHKTNGLLPTKQDTGADAQDFATEFCPRSTAR